MVLCYKIQTKNVEYLLKIYTNLNENKNKLNY
jgi:hypothetical protein